MAGSLAFHLDAASKPQHISEYEVEVDEEDDDGDEDEVESDELFMADEEIPMVGRIDVAFDSYKDTDTSIKDGTRRKQKKRSRPIRRLVENRDVPITGTTFWLYQRT